MSFIRGYGQYSSPAGTNNCILNNELSSVLLRITTHGIKIIYYFIGFYMNLSNYLYVFNQILSQGNNCDGRYYFDELSAWHDFDGYTCYIGYKDLIMKIYFHSKFSFEYEDKTTFSRFTKWVDDEQMTLREI